MNVNSKSHESSMMMMMILMETQHLIQAEVSVLSARVAFLDHQRLLLNVDNSPLKQRIAALAQDKNFKDASSISQDLSMLQLSIMASRALELWNYPSWLRHLIPHNMDGTERSNHVDLAALEIYRDRERGVARSNQFSRALFLIPISKGEDLADDKEVIKVLEEVYGSVAATVTISLAIPLQINRNLEACLLSITILVCQVLLFFLHSITA